jgi:hypothetical protein
MTICIFYFEGPDHGFERCLELGSDGFSDLLDFAESVCCRCWRKRHV